MDFGDSVVGVVVKDDGDRYPMKQPRSTASRIVVGLYPNLPQIAEIRQVNGDEVHVRVQQA